MATLQENARFGVAQADHAGVFENLPPLGVRQALLGLPEFLLHLPEVLPLAVVPVLLPQQEEENGAGGKAENDGQHFPKPDARLLFLQQGLKIHGAQVVGHALLWGLQLDGGVIQNQLSHPRQGRAHLQHLLGLLDPLGTLPADVVADDVREGLDRGVEFLMHRLQAELSSVQRLHHPHSDTSAILSRGQVEGSGVGSLVDDLLVVVPGDGEGG